ncbi:MAG: FkbM family methyltransferase [Pseudomonadota bacterium]
MSQPSNLDPLELRIIIKGQAVRLHLHEDEFLSNIIRRDGFWEMPQTKLLVAHVKKTDVILDIGANLGYYTVIAAKLASEGVVHAFEPDPANFALLERNCALNGCGNAVLHQMALSSESGPAQLFQSARNKGDHRLASSAKDGAAITIAREVGDVVLQALPRVDVIKCDTQGAEADVFAGLESLMARSVPKPLMLVEFEPTGLAAMGPVPRRAVRPLRPLGLLVQFRLLGETSFRSAGRRSWTSASIGSISSSPGTSTSCYHPLRHEPPLI